MVVGMESYTTKSGMVITVELLAGYGSMSEEDISQLHGISRQTLYRIRKKLNCPKENRSDKGVPRVDPVAKRRRWNEYMRKYQQVLRDDGRVYRNIRLGKMTRQEHRVIVEEVLGRPLLADEVVHHIDGDVTNNNKENLLVCDQNYHLNVLHGKDGQAYINKVRAEKRSPWAKLLSRDNIDV